MRNQDRDQLAEETQRAYREVFERTLPAVKANLLRTPGHAAWDAVKDAERFLRNNGSPMSAAGETVEDQLAGVAAILERHQ